jgi:predicted transposase YdaD
MDTPAYTHIVKTLVEQTEEHQETVMNIAQRLRNEGMEKGREEERMISQQKLANERQHYQQQMVLNLQQQAVMSLKLGLSVDIISQITGLSPSDIHALR